MADTSIHYKLDTENFITAGATLTLGLMFQFNGTPSTIGTDRIFDLGYLPDTTAFLNGSSLAGIRFSTTGGSANTVFLKYRNGNADVIRTGSASITLLPGEWYNLTLTLNITNNGTAVSTFRIRWKITPQPAPLSLKQFRRA